jgi:hypothetical protein
LIKTADFSHQSDFVSSFLPEIMCALLRRVVRNLPEANRNLIVTSQKCSGLICPDTSIGGKSILRGEESNGKTA